MMKNEKMKKTIVITILLFGLITSIQAQNRRGRMSAEDQEERIEQLAEELMLDDLQKYSFKSIMKKTMKQRSELMQQGLEREELRDHFKEIQMSEDEEMKKILDQDQFDQFIEYKKNLREEGRNKMKAEGRRRE
jgi:hypothetical protein